MDYEPIQNLTLTGGVKYAFFKRALNAPVQQKTEVYTGYTHDWGKFLPSFEVKYSFNPNLSAYAQAAEGFLAPNLNTFYTSKISSDSFNPETTWNYQVGGAYQDQHLALGADIYLVHFFNYIGSTGKGINKVFLNQGGAVYKGIEGEATYTFDSGFSLFANAGINDANYTNILNYNGNLPKGTFSNNAYIAQVPQYTANFGIIYDKNGLYASVIDELTGGEYGSGDTFTSTNPRVGGLWYDPYNVVNVALGYTFNDLAPHLSQLKVKLNVDNLTDQRQIIFDNGANTMGQNLYIVLPGTSAFVTVLVPLTF